MVLSIFPQTIKNRKEIEHMMLNMDFVIRLLVAGILGTIIGLDREYRAKEAGYRTHFLVSLGSALIMIVSQYGFQEIIKESSVTLDPSRVAAQVVSGIGFIGAGTIIFQKQIVRGLTTAAGIWATAGIGLAAKPSSMVMPRFFSSFRRSVSIPVNARIRQVFP